MLIKDCGFGANVVDLRQLYRRLAYKAQVMMVVVDRLSGDCMLCYCCCCCYRTLVLFFNAFARAGSIYVNKLCKKHMIELVALIHAVSHHNQIPATFIYQTA